MHLSPAPAGERLGEGASDPSGAPGMNGFFVTATDTGVGKTEIACALLRAARAAGVDAVGMKPAQAGATPGEPSDAERLRDASDRVEPLDATCPYSLAAPLAPAVAARLEGRTVELARILDAARALAARHDAIVVEGAGGLLVPLTERETYADLAVALSLPVIVVARAGLGTVEPRGADGRGAAPPGARDRGDRAQPRDPRGRSVGAAQRRRDRAAHRRESRGTLGVQGRYRGAQRDAASRDGVRSKVFDERVKIGSIAGSILEIASCRTSST